MQVLWLSAQKIDSSMRRRAKLRFSDETCGRNEMSVQVLREAAIIAAIRSACMRHCPRVSPQSPNGDVLMGELRTMKRRILSGCLFAIVGTCTLASAQSPFVGTWKLNQAKSHLTGNTVKYSAAPNSSIRETNAVGSYTFKTDGREYSAPFDSSAQWKQTSPSTFETTYRRNGMLLD